MTNRLNKRGLSCGCQRRDWQGKNLSHLKQSDDGRIVVGRGINGARSILLRALYGSSNHEQAAML